MDAFLAIKDHFSKGGIFELPDDLGKRSKALAMVSIVMCSFGIQQAALANSDHSLMNQYSPQTSSVAMEILNSEDFHLSVDPNAYATPESLDKIYKMVEHSIDQQFPETRGKVAVYNPFNDPIAESNRISEKIGSENAQNGLNEIYESRDKGYTGGKALSYEMNDGSGSCLAYGWNFDPSQNVTNQTMAHVIIHEAVGHCLDSAIYEKYAPTFKYYEEEVAYMKNAEAVAMITAADWGLKNGDDLSEIDKNIVDRQINGASDNLNYDLGDEYALYKKLYMNDMTQVESKDYLDFSNLRDSFEKGIVVRSLSTETAPSMLLRSFEEVSLREIEKSFTNEDTGVIDYVALNKYISDFHDIPFLKKLDQGHDYYDAIEADKEGIVDADVSLEKRESFEKTYGKLIKHQKENPSEVTENVIAWFEIGGKKLERFEYYRLGEKSSSFKEFSDKIKSDDAFLEDVINGESKIFSKYSGSYSVIQDKGDLLNLPQFKSDSEKMVNIEEKEIFSKALDFIDKVEPEAWVFLNDNLKDSKIYLERAMSGDKINLEDGNKVVDFMKSVASTEIAKKSLSVDFMDHLNIALKKASQDKDSFDISEENVLKYTLNLMKEAEKNFSKENALEMRGGRLALERVSETGRISEKSWGLMVESLDKAYSLNAKPDFTTDEFVKIKEKFSKKYVSSQKKNEKNDIVR